MIEPSPHRMRVYLCLKEADGRWMTNREVLDACPGLAVRTVGNHTADMAKEGVLEEVKAWGGYRYRLAPTPDVHAKGRRDEYDTFAAMFGIAA